MNSKILDIISRISKKAICEIEDNLNTKELWDSFSHLELVLSLEEEFNIVLDPEEIAEMRTPQEVNDIVSHKVG